MCKLIFENCFGVGIMWEKLLASIQDMKPVGQNIEEDHNIIRAKLHPLEQLANKITIGLYAFPGPSMTRVNN